MSNEPNALDPRKPKPVKPTEAGIANETVFPHPEMPTAVPRAPVATGGTGATSTADWVGKSLGKYQINAVLGQGGMGVVLKARDPLIEREVAIKLLADHLVADETARSRFLAEARAVGKLSHANVAAIFEICQEEGRTFLVMEYLPGGSLSDQLERQGAFSTLEATKALIDACRGLAAAHAAGLIHRDIKPANFMRAADGSVKVMDFGLAKADGGRGLTQTGVVMGTPFFMSPEQCEAKPLDARGDIYSLGATYYSLLTGQNPYQQSSSVVQLMYSHVHAPPPDPRGVRPEVPPACAQVVSRAMAKAPGERYQSANDMLADLLVIAATLSGQMISLPSQTQAQPALAAAAASGAAPSALAAPKRRRTVAIVTGAALGLAAAILLVWRPWEKTAPSVVPPPSGAPIKVGVLHSRTGTMSASELPVIDAVRLAFDEINQSGGLLGRSVEPVVADGRSDESVFAREAERLIAHEKVVVLFGCWTSASRKAVKPVVEQHDHLLIYPLQYEGLETSPNIVYMGAAPNQQILPTLDWSTKELGKKRFFLVGSDYVFPRTANEIIKDHLKKLGATVVGEMYLPLGGQEVGPIVKAIEVAKPDMILNTINGDSNIAFFRALRARVKAKELPSLSFSIGEQGLSSLNPADMEGDYAAWTYFQAIATPENEQFLKRFHAKHPDRPVTDPMEAAYVGVKLWAQTVIAAESADPKKVRRAMLNQRLAAPCGEARIDPDTQHCVKTPRIGQVQADGSFKVIWTAAQALAPDPYPPSRTADQWRAFLHDLYNGWGKRWSAPPL